MIHGSETLGSTELDLDTGEIDTVDRMHYTPDRHGYVALASGILWTVILTLTFTAGFLLGLLKAALT